MKAIEQYKCEICGTLYTDKTKCIKCEAGHKIPTKIRLKRYQPIYVNQRGWPETIDVATKEGDMARYRLCGTGERRQ